MGKCLLIFFLCIIVPHASPIDTCIIFSEIMFNSPSVNNEFIELYNRSKTSYINLDQYKIKYYTGNPDTIVSAGYGTILPPGSYAVIFEGDYDISTGIYKNIIPPYSHILKISNNAFGSNGMSNTSDRPLWLLNVLDDTIDCYTYSANNSSGYSDEKIMMNKDTSAFNWGNSNRSFGTPGFQNSLLPKLNDLQISSFNSTPFVPTGENVELKLKIRNLGANVSSNFNIEIYNDLNRDSTAQPAELIISQTSNGIQSKDSTEVLLSTNKYNAGANFFIAKITLIPDEDLSNNIAYTNFNVGVYNNNEGTIVINEIMFAPSVGEPEWIELYNRTNLPVQITNWTITDIYTNPTTVKITSDISIGPKSYLIICRDSSIFNSHLYIPSPVLKLNIPPLNNDGDGIIIKDYTGQIIDSVKYDPLWGGNNGYSLERISIDVNSLLKDNWGISIDLEQSTPGRINSLESKLSDLSITGISFNPIYPTPGDDVSISAIIKNNGILSADNFTVEFNCKTDSTSWNLISVSNGLNLSPGDSLNVVCSQIIKNIQCKFIISAKVLVSSDQDTLNNHLEKILEPGAAQRSIIINEIMYDPESGEAEWIELKNISSESINLKNWYLSDIITPSKYAICNQDFLIPPNDLIIAARDTIFCLLHPELNSKAVVVKFGILGNTEDGLIVYDYRDAIIDSVFYNSSWGHKKGYSLERISPDRSSNDSSNWTLSLCVEKSTPGNENSVINIPPAVRYDMIINEIMYNPSEGNNEFLEFLNLKKEQLNIGGWSIQDQHGNRYKLSDTIILINPGAYFLLAADSSVIWNYNLLSFNNKAVLNESSLGLTTNELVLLKDLRGNVIDSLYYSDTWNNKNFNNTKDRSLERINPFLNSNDRYNWDTCVDPKGATPGSKIYDSRGRLVRILGNNISSGSTGSIIFDGLGDDGLALRIGIYIIFLEALNSTTGQNEILKTTVVVARKLK